MQIKDLIVSTLSEKIPRNFNYDILEEIGHGAYGKVKKAKIKNSNQVLCIKFINLERAKQTYEEAEQEVKIWKQLNHPNIVRYYEHFPHKNKMCIVMEYFEGITLRKLINEAITSNLLLDERFILHVFAQLISALQFCHSLNIIHRDIKPENIIITDDDHVKLIDFGLSKKIENSDKLAKTFAGTPVYMSPEMLKGLPYSFLTDVWSLGCVLYEMMTFHHPIAYDFLTIIQNLPGEKIAKIHQPYSKELKKVVYNMLQI